MVDLPTKVALESALSNADAAHEEYERATLNGVVDERWAGFYAAYLIGRFGDFALPSRLAALIEESEEDDWSVVAEHLLTKLRS